MWLPGNGGVGGNQESWRLPLNFNGNNGNSRPPAPAGERRQGEPANCERTRYGDLPALLAVYAEELARNHQAEEAQKAIDLLYQDPARGCSG